MIRIKGGCAMMDRRKKGGGLKYQTPRLMVEINEEVDVITSSTGGNWLEEDILTGQFSKEG